jgi:ubiquinone/menaquinone biosynthesis C-methylase UbiE
MRDPTSTGDHPFPAVPANYRKGARPTWHQRRRHCAVLQLLRRVPGKVLDYGCGYGDVTQAISKTHSVQGVDVDPERVAFAAREYAPIQFTRCDPGRLSFPDQSFDIVASIVVIHFVPDPIQHLLEARRVLGDNGYLLIACGNVQKVRTAFRRLLGRGEEPTKLWLRPEPDVRKLLQDHGFQIEADGYFYDPPFEGWKNLGDVIVGMVQQLLSLCRVRTTCNFFLFLARKVSR